MAKRSTTVFEPDYTVIPGKTLAETLEKTGMTQSELAERAGLARKTINGIINGSEPITPDTAIQLEKVFRVPARLWMSLQKNYEEAVARLKERGQLAAFRNWIAEEEIPLKELVKRGIVPRGKDAIEQVSAVLRFFGVKGPAEYDRVWGATLAVYSYRRSAKRRTSTGCVTTWLRLGELAASELQCSRFDRSRFEDAVARIRERVRSDVAECQRWLVQTLAQSGVALVFIPGIAGAPIHGATRWHTPMRAVVQMSLRGKDDGNFWFTLFHELGHIVLHGKKDIFLEIDEGETTDKERQADSFAQNRLIPPGEYRAFVQAHGGGETPVPLRISKAAIQDLARRVHVPPGVVVGRLQHDGWLPRTHCNDLKVRLGFAQ